MSYQKTFLVLIAMLLTQTAVATENVDNILHQIEVKSSPPSERVDLKMTIQESDGAKKQRELSITRKNDGDARALIRLQKPSDLKGLALLTVAKGNKEEQYLYLPSDKKSRRILGSSKKGKFLDSEIAYEDLAISTYRDFDNKVIKQDNKLIEIESRARKHSDSSYGRILTWVTPDYKIDHVDYFDKSNKLLKHAQFKDYQQVGAKFWRARTVSVQNVQTKRKTQLLVTNVSLKKIDDDEVSLSALED